MRPNVLRALRSCSVRRIALDFDRHGAKYWTSSGFRDSTQGTVGFWRRPTLISSRTPMNQSNRGFSLSSKTDDTIYALSTASGRAAIAIIRISGPACIEICQGLCSSSLLPTPRRATLRKLYHPRSPPSPATILDTALVLYFPSPTTVTGEDILELHVHGGPAIVSAVLAAIPQCPIASGSQVRYAEPGEFTRRAFLNDRLDLTQIEALGDSLVADTEQQRRLSIRGQGSGLSKQYEEWRYQLLYARGELEALIDFSEDQYFDESPSTLTTSVSAQVRNLRALLAIQRENAVRGELLRNGISIALLGAPNAGKSSLLNRIVGREAAIVSQEAGTTRDVVEVGIDLGGYLVRVGDMAGLRSPSSGNSTLSIPNPENTSAIGEVEREGIARAKARALDSDVVVVVLAISNLPSQDGPKETQIPSLYLDPDVLSTAAICQAEKGNILVVINKTDLLGPEEPLPTDWINSIKAAIPTLDPSQIFPISCKPSPQSTSSSSEPPRTHETTTTSSGIQNFLTAGLLAKFEALTTPLSLSSSTNPSTPTQSLSSRIEATDPSLYRAALGASARQRGLLDSCLEALDAYLALGKNKDSKDGDNNKEERDEIELDIVIAAEHLRAAADCLAKITGRGVEAGDVEEVLGVVFEKFCVGK